MTELERRLGKRFLHTSKCGSRWHLKKLQETIKQMKAEGYKFRRVIAK